MEYVLKALGSALFTALLVWHFKGPRSPHADGPPHLAWRIYAVVSDLAACLGYAIFMWLVWWIW